jgi:cytochrome c553
MRRFIFFLMILLLPLRGWMGEAMATEMAAMNIIAFKAEKTTASVSIPVAKGMANCDMLKAKTVESKTAKPACNYCQACHASGIASTVEINSFDKIHYSQPFLQVHAFTSASLALGQKPPIF